MRGQAGDPLTALQQRIHRSEGLAHDILHAHETASNALFRELKDGGFGVAEHVLGSVGLIARSRDGSAGG